MEKHYYILEMQTYSFIENNKNVIITKIVYEKRKNSSVRYRKIYKHILEGE